jgi:hypothetical protein
MSAGRAVPDRQACTTGAESPQVLSGAELGVRSIYQQPQTRHEVGGCIQLPMQATSFRSRRLPRYSILSEAVEQTSTAGFREIRLAAACCRSSGIPRCTSVTHPIGKSNLRSAC